MRVGTGVMAAAIIGLGGAAIAQTPPAASLEGSPQLQRLLACRTISDSAERLACFDREATATETAIARRDIVVVDRNEVVKSRRSLFGFPLPSLAIFGGGEDDEKEQVREVEGVIAAATLRGDDNWVFRLEDGATWTQTDSRPLAVTPKRGHKVLIKRGALGGYMLSFEGTTGIKVRRTG